MMPQLCPILRTPSPCTLLPSPYSLLPTPYSLHPAPCTLYPAPPTGVWYGETINGLKDHFDRLVSIEISEQIAELARKRFASE